MAGSLNRTFSFNDNDETSLRSNTQEHSIYPQPYQDVPGRDIGVSPLPSNISPPPRDYTVSPPSPPPHYSTSTSNAIPNPQRRQPSVPRRPLPPSIATSYQQNSYSQPQDQAYPPSARSLITPGADNLGESTVGGGIAGIALGVAHTNERDSGVQAVRSMYESGQRSPERGYSPMGAENPYIPDPPYRSRNLQQHDSYSSVAPLTAAAATPGNLTPQPYDAGREMAQHSYPQERDLGSGRRSAYVDNPYQGYSTAWDPRVDQGEFDPDEIDDDGDDGMLEPRKRRSLMGLGRGSDQSIPMAAVAGGATAGGILGGLGSMVGKKAVGSRSDPSGQYGPVAAQGLDGIRQEKLDYAQRQTSRRKRLRWVFGILGALVIVGIIVGAVAGVLTSQKKSNNKDTGGESAAQDDSTDLDKNSAEIQKLLGNTNLHKVFPGMDYTPFNAQYPDCLTNPPSQNNVTRDMAVLSQLTNAVRLYGTDCNQTEMVLHAMDKLALTDMKIWLGVWLGNNDTTNDRQLNAMYTILDKNGATPFAGVIVGNEVLFRKDLTETALGDVLTEVKSNLTDKKINLPVATSDLGTDWTATLAESVDIVMSNIHPFFGGVAAPVAASWTWNFWGDTDLPLTKGTSKQNIIAETGWPSAGGNECLPTNCTTPTQGSVAGISEMNRFMDDFVCQSLANGTQYFW